MTINIEEEVEVSFPFDYKKLAEEVICGALEAEDFPFEAEIGLLLVSLEGIQEINGQQRNLDYPTDVLSFPMIAYKSPGDFTKVRQEDDNFNPDTGEAMLGDIVLYIQQSWKSTHWAAFTPGLALIIITLILAI